jgi:hypothetical protein
VITKYQKVDIDYNNSVNTSQKVNSKLPDSFIKISVNFKNNNKKKVLKNMLKEEQEPKTFDNMTQEEQEGHLISQLNTLTAMEGGQPVEYTSLKEAFKGFRAAMAKNGQEENSEKETFDEKWRREMNEYLKNRIEELSKKNAEKTDSLFKNLEKLDRLGKN